MRKSSRARTDAPGGRGSSSAAASVSYGSTWAAETVLSAAVEGAKGKVLGQSERKRAQEGRALVSSASEATVSCFSFSSCAGDSGGSAPDAAAAVQ